jgi:hypothetical protein
MAKLLSNFLPTEMADELEEILNNHEFPWFWRPSTAHGMNDGNEASSDYQFVHIVFYDGQPQSELFNYVRPLLFEFEKATGHTIKDLYKIKANLLPKQELDDAGLEETIHTDVDKCDKNYLSIVYYVSDSDGDTVIYDDNGNVALQASPVKGSAVYFPSYMRHRATPPALNKRRTVLNMIVELI